MQDLFAILQGYNRIPEWNCGKRSFAAIGAALDVVGNFATSGNLGTLQNNKNKIEKWLTFGKAYKALNDSSDLNFDTMDITSVPEVMKANLEMNKESLTAGLACMLEVDERYSLETRQSSRSRLSVSSLMALPGLTS
ncbi:hypothetical protein OS493_035738 [Desmophyllum pertusum]|uniref:Uncharacterized protein n=1 Tax=Desmophyllum pertusum TaxID=174260 RepID=A0A9W9ZW19_9CNID|nr:hypothetical protein OS493_035738 [Desmophyllum pertusum]